MAIAAARSSSAVSAASVSADGRPDLVGGEAEREQPPARRAHQSGQRRDSGQRPGLGPDVPGTGRAGAAQIAVGQRARPAGDGQAVGDLAQSGVGAAVDQAQHGGQRGGREAVAGGEPAGVDHAGTDVDAQPAQRLPHRRRRAGEARRLVLGDGDLPSEHLGDDVVGVLQHLPDELSVRRRVDVGQYGRARRRRAPGHGGGRQAELGGQLDAGREVRASHCGWATPGVSRPPSAITAVIADSYSLGTSSAIHAGEIAGPVNSESSTTTWVMSVVLQRGGQVTDPRGVLVELGRAGRGGRRASDRRRRPERRRRASRRPPRSSGSGRSGRGR